MQLKAKLVAIGSFDPPTFAHLRMFERAKEYLEFENEYEIVEGIMSIIPDVFRSKICEANHKQRMEMLKRILRGNRWIRADDYQCNQSPQLNFPQVLEHINNTYNIDHCGTKISTVFLCNNEFFENVSVDNTNYCTTLELKNILSKFNVIVVCPSNIASSSCSTSAINMSDNKTKLFIVHDDVYCGTYSGKRISPPIPTKKKQKNLWKIVNNEPNTMCCSTPHYIMHEYFDNDDKQSINDRNNSLSPYLQTSTSSQSKMYNSLPIKSINYNIPSHHVSDPTLLLTCKNSIPLSEKSISTVSFTFQQFNLSYTPESTV